MTARVGIPAEYDHSPRTILLDQKTHIRQYRDFDVFSSLYPLVETGRGSTGICAHIDSISPCRYKEFFHLEKMVFRYEISKTHSFRPGAKSKLTDLAIIG